jgi:hypothetical protein
MATVRTPVAWTGSGLVLTQLGARRTGLVVRQIGSL